MSESAVKVREVIARLEAWQEGEHRIAEDFGGVEESFTAEACEHRVENYGELIKILTAAAEDIESEGKFVREHVTVKEVATPTGSEAYKALSRALNASSSPWLDDFMGGFKGDHPTLQANLYRELNAHMRLSHRFNEDDDRNVTCIDGRIAGDLPNFIVNGHIPYI